MADKKTNPIKKIVTITLFTLLIASFGAWGIGDIFQGPTHSYSVAEVGKVSISQQDFSRNLRQELGRLGPQFGGRLDIEQAQALGIVRQVLDRLVNRALFEQHANELGLVVTSDQLREQIATLPAFQDATGRFSAFQFEQALRNSGLTETTFLAGLTSDIQRQQLTSAISSAAMTPRTLADALYRYSGETRTAETVVFRNDSITDLPEPTDAQVQTFYDNDSGSFLAPEYRKISVLQIRPDKLTGEVAVSDEQLRDEYELRKEELSIPELRSVSQVLFQSEDDAKDALAKVREGRDFSAVASETGAGTPVSLGLVSRSELSGQLPELAEAAFAVEQGGVSEPVQSPLGWHLALVSEIQEGKITPFEDVADQLRSDLKLNLATDTAISLANSLDDTMAGGSSLEAAAGALGLQVENFERVDRSGNGTSGEKIADLPDDRTFITTVFSTDVGQDSLLTETADGSYFVVRPLEVIPAAKKPLADVRNDVIEAWKEAEVTRLLNEKAKVLSEAVNNGGDFAALAEEAGLSLTTTPALRRFNTTPTPGIPLDLPTKLFELQQGKADVVDDAEGIMVARLTEIAAAPAATADTAIKTLQTNLAGRMQNDLVSQFMVTLNSSYSVDINNRNLDTVLSQF
ncbi:SurA N-terminal domain-containing protein [Pelagibius sp. Alg239-R121]|uniref:SurA N-terminal domain-containing protein n=1 Tax=Pelagibius sp. Alg239-R121 TaxID=2993448 RepID=UPI0024A65952|nr:SurA N-terminal domain-containing protein [Pelagibius sp. Alg239-R121]